MVSCFSESTCWPSGSLIMDSRDISSNFLVFKSVGRLENDVTQLHNIMLLIEDSFVCSCYLTPFLFGFSFSGPFPDSLTSSSSC